MCSVKNKNIWIIYVICMYWTVKEIMILYNNKRWGGFVPCLVPRLYFECRRSRVI